MRTLYLDCGMGAAGDMLAAALFELCEDKEAFLQELNGAGIPGVKVTVEPSVKCGIGGTHFSVKVFGEDEESVDVHEHDHEHHHHDDDTQDHHHSQHHDGHSHGMHDHHDHDHNNLDHDIHDQQHLHHEHDDHDHNIHGNHHHDEGIHNHDHHHANDMHDHHHHHDDHGHHHTHSHGSYSDICEMISSLRVSKKVKEDAANVYKLIAEAESTVHGTTMTDIHFHEVGTMDAVADVVAVSMLIERLAPEKILASAVHVGYGKVRCAHGILPVPAPATALLLKDVPIYSGRIEGELCTPTGAALLKYFVSSFGVMPQIQVRKIGYGMGTKDFAAANCVRALLGETDSSSEPVCELCCNLDDMTPEAIAFVGELLFDAGALDVYTVNIGMKKNRPGIQLWCMCHTGKLETMRSLLFRHTTTWGIRVYESKRFVLERRIETVDTLYGPVRIKSAVGCQFAKSKIEYEDLARIARERGISLAEAAEMVK